MQAAQRIARELKSDRTGTNLSQVLPPLVLRYHPWLVATNNVFGLLG
jgi:hypothetical protein